MWKKLERVWKVTQVRNSVLFVLAMLVIFRFAAHIPVPGVDQAALNNLLTGNDVLGLLNVFSGGTLENFSIVMLGVAPYITSSIVFQLLVMVVPALERIKEEGQAGQQKISMYTRLATVPFAMLQAFGLIKLLSQTGQGVIAIESTVTFLGTVCIVTAGTVFLMWIGELITERKIGNGISLLIFAGIVSALPGLVQTAIINYTPSDLYTYVLFIAMAIATVVGVVFVSEGQRNIPVHYARQASGRSASGAAISHLPLRVNTAGVIPIIFAISVVIFPQTVGQLLMTRPDTIGRIAAKVVEYSQNEWIYGVVYFLLCFGFTYFYTSVVFHPNKMAENLQRQGGFIPGIRPGKETEAFLAKTMNRLTLIGALFLSGVAVLPFVMQGITGTQSLALGGTGLLICVSVAIDTARQIEAQLTLHEYDRV
jgi:preprotein translocase subunit SecY